MTVARLTYSAIAALTAILALLIVVSVLALGANDTPAAQLSELPGQVGDIPPAYMALYVSTGRTFSIDWAVLAAIGKIETDHGRSTSPGVRTGVNFAGCCAGPMQFSIVGSRSTWSAYGRDDDRDGQANVYSPGDAIPAAGRYLHASGAPKNYRAAIFAYNHSQAYVDNVLRTAGAYRRLATTPSTNATAWQLLSNPKLTLSPTQRADLANGRIDPRVIALISWALESHTLYISSLRSDHSTNTSSGNVSNHSTGRAVDIAMVDAQACTGTRSSACGRLVVQIARLSGAMRSSELIYCFDPDGAASGDAFAAADHCAHIHAGYDA